MTRQREAELRAAAMIYFAKRMIPPEEIIAMRFEEMAVLLVYLSTRSSGYCG